MREPTFPRRLRDHEASHVRTIEQQVLDTLLRIEERLCIAQSFEPTPTPTTNLPKKGRK